MLCSLSCKDSHGKISHWFSSCLLPLNMRPASARSKCPIVIYRCVILFIKWFLVSNLRNTYFLNILYCYNKSRNPVLTKVTNDSHVLLMSAVMFRPSIVRTLVQFALVTITTQIVQPNLSFTWSERVADDFRKAVPQLSTDNISLFSIPVVLTNGSPPTHPVNFDSAFVWGSSAG